jgi:hypothetical protein
VPRTNDAPDGALTDAAERRMANQIARVFRGTYGATTGFRIIATSLARQMLVAGASPDAIAGALARCVLAHPNQAGAGTASASRMLVALTAECVARAALEETTPPPPTPSG